MPSLTNSHFPVILICPRINITLNGSAVKGDSCQAQVTDMIAETQSVSLSEAGSVSDSDSE